MRAIASAAAVVLALVLPVGCAPAGRTVPPSPKAREVPSRPAAGVERLAGGRAIARGWVARWDVEGGFWAVVDVRPGPDSSRQPQVVAVLLPGEVTEDEIARLEGTFIGAEGVLQEGPSIRMAGPEIVVDAIRAY